MPTTTRRTAPTQAQLAAARARLAHLEDPDEQAWHEAAAAAVAEHDAKAERWQHDVDQARNRRDRRAVGAAPRLRLPALPDFAATATPAARSTGDILGRFLVHPDPQNPTGGVAHDVTRATASCRIGQTPRTFVHFRDELAAAFPDAELCPRCAAPAGDA